MTAHCYFGCMHTAIKYGQECCIDGPVDWFVLSTKPSMLMTKLSVIRNFPLSFLHADWSIGCMWPLIGNSDFFRYALIIGPLTSPFLRLHISYTRVTIRAPLGRGFAASRSVAIKIKEGYSNKKRRTKKPLWSEDLTVIWNELCRNRKSYVKIRKQF